MVEHAIELHFCSLIVKVHFQYFRVRFIVSIMPVEMPKINLHLILKCQGFLIVFFGFLMMFCQLSNSISFFLVDVGGC